MAWAVYTVAYRRSGLDPWQGAALICGWSTVAVTPWWLLSDAARLLDAPARDVAIQSIVQGGMAGLAGMVVYGIAVDRLGSNITALSGAAVPALTALGAWALLDERIEVTTAIGVALVAAGLATYALGGRHAARDKQLAK